jgi:hypothetical protein
VVSVDILTQQLSWDDTVLGTMLLEAAAREGFSTEVVHADTTSFSVQFLNDHDKHCFDIEAEVIDTDCCDYFRRWSQTTGRSAAVHADTARRSGKESQQSL